MTRKTLAVRCLIAVLAASGAAQVLAQAAGDPIEELLLGTWSVAERRIEYENAVVRQVGGKVHIADRNPDGTYRVLVRMSSHIATKDGSPGSPIECNGEEECVIASATEGIGVYSNGRFFIDYSAENWYDDVFKIDGLTMSGRDPNGPILLEKDTDDAPE